MKNRKVCEKCRRGGFIVKTGLFKPVFKCQACDYEWSSGRSGGDCFASALNSEGHVPTDFVEIVTEIRR